MSLRQEIKQICLSINIFEKKVDPLRQQLFNFPGITDNLIWNQIWTSLDKSISQKQFQYSISKYGTKADNKSIKLLFFNYSSQKNNLLNKSDLWELFRPKNIKYMEQILQVRRIKNALASCTQSHYKIIDLITKIIDYTLEFQEILEVMKINVLKTMQEIQQQFILKVIDAQHLQAYINAQLTTKQCKIILQYIIKNSNMNQRVFYGFWIPFSYKSKKINPFFNNSKDDFKSGLVLLKNHKLASHYGLKFRSQKKSVYL